MKVYLAINKVQAALAKEGITKSRTNTQGASYKFRGIDDIFNTISPLLAEHGLCILPRVLARECVERTSRAGGALYYVTVEVEFDFVCAEDGSKHTVKTFGEAMDSSDKATNKAMSAAYKYAALQAFAIPTESDNDADLHTPIAMPTIDINAYKKSINGATTLSELKANWDIAFTVFKNDPLRQQELEKAKDKRKAELLAIKPADAPADTAVAEEAK